MDEHGGCETQTQALQFALQSISDALVSDIWMIRLAIQSYVHSFRVNKDATPLFLRIQCNESQVPVVGCGRGEVERIRR